MPQGPHPLKEKRITRRGAHGRLFGQSCRWACSILNIRDEEIEIVEPVIEMDEVGNEDVVTVASAEAIEQGRGRDERAPEQLRMEHLNSEERKSLQRICFDYQDVFYLPSDQLSCTNAVKQLNFIPGTTPINTRHYRLPETQKQEVDKQLTKLLKGGIVEESNSPWNSPILVPK